MNLEDSSFHRQSNEGSALCLTQSNASIVRSSFNFNTIGTLHREKAFLDYSLDTHPSKNRYHHSTAGGALVVTNSVVEIRSSNFESNSAEIGGAIFFHKASDVTITNCTFFNNSALSSNARYSCYGGALFIDSECSVMVENSTFRNNTSEFEGGAIALFRGMFFGIQNIFCHNDAFKSGGVFAAYDESVVIIRHSYYSHNTVGLNGGVMYAFGDSEILVHDSVFAFNEAAFDGGVIYLCGRRSTRTVTVDRSFFNNNKAGDRGGVMSVSDESFITVTNSSFDKNWAVDDGGVIYLSKSSTIVKSSYFVNNKAGNNGGVLCTFSSSITVCSSCFEDNKANNDGGVVTVLLSSTLTVVSSSFDSNLALNNGGALLTSLSSSINATNSSFCKNAASNSGGVMYSSFSSKITIDNSYFVSNVASNSGGVMFGTNTRVIISYEYIYSNVTKFVFKNKCKFINNTASNGGVLYVRDAFLSDFRNVYQNNLANGNGGVAILDGASMKVTGSSYFNNTARNYGGVLVTLSYTQKHEVILRRSVFLGNRAISGGVVTMFANNILTVAKSSFHYNSANNGGVIYLLFQNMLIIHCSRFSYNLARRDGGVINSAFNNYLSIDSSEFNFNLATKDGGVFYLLFQAELTLGLAGDNSSVNSFVGNHAHTGGVIYAGESNIDVHSKKLLMTKNRAIERGGAVYLSKSNFSFFNDRSLLLGNLATSGGAICADESKINFHSGNDIFVGNHAKFGGALHAFVSKIDVRSQSLLMANNTALESGGAILSISDTTITFFSGINNLMDNNAKRGGAVFVSEGQIEFSASINLTSNQAERGGAIYANKSQLCIEMHSQMQINYNSVTSYGGGFYLIMSELNVKGYSSYITGNNAVYGGGGLVAGNSTIRIEGTIHFIDNIAGNGGGIRLERNAKLHGISSSNDSIVFISNRARNYGGALYVDDSTDIFCALDYEQTETETSATECFSSSLIFNFCGNSAGLSGSNLFGGFLDRCTVSMNLISETETSNSSLLISFGIVNFLRSSNINELELNTISSHPVRLCFCRDGWPDCNYQPEVIQVNKGNIFLTDLIAYDQIHTSVNASVRFSLNSSAGGLGEGQVIQQISESCTELNLTLFSPLDFEELTVSLTGECSVSGISKRSVMIDITCNCPIGFQTSNNDETSCDCVCDDVLKSYHKTECDAKSQSIIRKENFWIAFINNVYFSGYVIYSHCPYDYCHPPEKQIHVNLNIPNGSDAQCASHRSGTLCGMCKSGFSISLGSSSCLKCPVYWPALLVTIIIVFILSGFFLVALLLVFNLTVAIGTINAIIFYVNIMAANKNALFSTSKISFASIFISLLNFDLGIDTCFFPGMDVYVKTWLQLAFPAYIILLVAAIINLSYHFTFFGNLIGRKDPVATLATLLLLSYAKLIQTIITAFSSATLDYPDGSTKYVWLPDASIEYLHGKHAALSFAAMTILLLGVAYTLLLFLWQWFLYCPRKRVKWIFNQKLSSFLSTYHIPYTSKHRYWTGLLLFIRVSVYLISAFNPSSKHRITLLFTTFIMTCLVIYMAMFSLQVYKNRFINAMEIATYFNIITVSIFSWYIFDSNVGNQEAITNISVGVTFVQLLIIIFFHAYRYTCPKAFKKIINCQNLLLKRKQKPTRSDCEPPPTGNNNVHRYNGFLDKIDRPVKVNNTNVAHAEKEQADGPTHSVVELTIPRQAPPQQLKEIKV